MTRILIAASVALIGFTGLAAAQQSPVLFGDYTANVLDSHNGTTTESVDFSGAAAIQAPATAEPAAPSHSILSNENYSR